MRNNTPRSSTSVPSATSSTATVESGRNKDSTKSNQTSTSQEALEVSRNKNNRESLRRDKNVQNSKNYEQEKEPLQQSPEAEKIKRERRSPSPNLSTRSPRGRRSRSPTNTIIVRRKSIKSITLPPSANDLLEEEGPLATKMNHQGQNTKNTHSSDFTNTRKQDSSRVTTTLDDDSGNVTTSTTASTTAATMQRTTADGKPIGYATKIMGSPNTLRHHSTVIRNHHHLHYQQQHDDNDVMNTGNIIPDSPEKIQNDLDTYIEQSFRDIDKSISSSNRRYRRQSGVTDSREDVSSTSAQSLPITTNGNSNTSDISEIRRERRREKNRERQMRLLQAAEQDNNNKNNNNNNNNSITLDKNNNNKNSDNDDVFECEELKDIKPLNRNSNIRQSIIPTRNERKSKLGSMKNPNEEELQQVQKYDSSKTNGEASITSETSTMDTMKEFEDFLKKQERKTKREMRRLSRTGTGSFRSQSHDDLSRDRDFTLERYKTRQEKRRLERKEFQEQHLRERRVSLVNRWPSLTSLRGGSRNGLSGSRRPALERKLSLPSNLNHTQRFARSSSSLSTTSSTESLEEDDFINMNRNYTNIRRGRGVGSGGGGGGSDTLSGRHSAPPTSPSSGDLTRRHTFSGLTEKQRSNSTGHSPDMDDLLQHLICDIEEEIVTSDDDLKAQQLESFNTNLNQLKRSGSQSEDTLYQSQSLPRKTAKGLVHRFTKDHVVTVPGGAAPSVRGSRVSSLRREFSSWLELFLPSDGFLFRFLVFLYVFFFVRESSVYLFARSLKMKIPYS